MKDSTQKELERAVQAEFIAGLRKMTKELSTGSRMWLRHELGSITPGGTQFFDGEQVAPEMTEWVCRMIYGAVTS